MYKQISGISANQGSRRLAQAADTAPRQKFMNQPADFRVVSGNSTDRIVRDLRAGT